ncbi:hypothetical protein SprV_0301327400 [Sparganum proliferum]
MGTEKAAPNLEADLHSVTVEVTDDHVAHVSFSWWLAVLLGIFGISSWVAINGLWMELPLLVNVLPERWNLPAYLSIIIQIANFGPLLYVVLTRICRAFNRRASGRWMQLIQPPERLANYTILLFGFLASVLLTQFWSVVLVVPGLPPNVDMGDSSPEAINGHSVGLFVLTFLLGLIDCMSSVTFLAYLANMPAVYAGALLFGETCSGLLPSLFALVQGANPEPICHNVTVNGTSSMVAEFPPPRFPVSTFMGLVAATTFLSLTAFSLLDCLPCGLGRAVTLSYQKLHSLPQTMETAYTDPVTVDEAAINAGDTSQGGVGKPEEVPAPKYGQGKLFFVCFLLTGYASCLSNGLLPSLQSYSAAAYNTLTYHLAVTLSGLAAPLAALLTTIIYDYEQFGLCARALFARCLPPRDPNSTSATSVWSASAAEGDYTSKSTPAAPDTTFIWRCLILVAVLASVPAAYIFYLAASSPAPPHLGGLGPAVAVLAWILTTAGFTVQKTWITLFLVKFGNQRNLRTLGIATQTGSLIGALISFLLTAQFNLLISKTPCT